MMHGISSREPPSSRRRRYVGLLCPQRPCCAEATVLFYSAALSLHVLSGRGSGRDLFLGPQVVTKIQNVQ